MGKKERDAEEARSPDQWERFRALMESVDQGRRLTEVVDHKARYALVLIGVVNAAVIYLATRSDFRYGAPGWLLPWLGILVVVYILATCNFLWQAIQALRPRRLLPHGASRGGGVSGLLVWEGIVQRDLESYRQAWARVTMEELNQELIVVAYVLAALIRAKYDALERMYVRLFVVLGLATAIIALDAWFGLV